MRAILINPEKKTITEIQMTENCDFREINRVLQCREHTSGAHLGGTISKGFDAVYVSDDQLEDRDDPRFWFQVDADRDPPSSYPIAGLGLALGTDPEGNGCDVRISVDELTKRITFTERKFRGFEVETFDPPKRVGPFQAHIQISTKAPIIDGTDEDKKPVAPTRPESWNAKMVSGKPLITDKQIKRLLANHPRGFAPGAPLGDVDLVPVVKIFLPHVRWLLVWIYPDNHDLAFAIVKWGNDKPQLGDVRLSDIVRHRLGPLPPERDMYTKLDRPMSYYVSNYRDW